MSKENRYLPSFLNRRSLVGRFFIASLIILPLFILLSGTLLINSFEHSQLNAEEEKLQTQLYLLLSVTEVDAGSASFPEVLTEPRFNQSHSGLYGFVLDQDHNELWRSASAELLPSASLLSTHHFERNQRLFISHSPQELISTANQPFNLLSYDTEWIDDEENIQQLRFIIINDASPLAAELNSYRSRLWQWLGSMGIALILAQVLIMRWGLQPLTRLQTELGQLHQEKINQLGSRYPTEIQPIVDNFNSIMTQEQEQRTRYRNTMSDLAHSLKTPLAVIQSQLENSEQKDPIIHQQLDRVQQIISHQLQRAVIQTNHNIAGLSRKKVMVYELIERLLATMKKVYRDKALNFKNLSQTDCYFYGDEADLLEVLGNLIDNACKHGEDAVTVIAENYIRDNTHYLEINISDNGQGIAQHQSQSILQRGERADTAQPGQGIGLSVVVDIVSSYGGEIRVSNQQPAPHLPGACFCVCFELGQIS